MILESQNIRTHKTSNGITEAYKTLILTSAEKQKNYKNNSLRRDNTKYELPTRSRHSSFVETMNEPSRCDTAKVAFFKGDNLLDFIVE
jgi:hypothetical protein